MNALPINLAIYLFAFLLIWASSGLIVSSVIKISHRFQVSSFFLSFLLLGFLTSIPEIAVGFSAVANDRSGIFVGNLLGGIPILFFLVIPLLALFGGGMKLNHNLSQRSILFSLLVSIAPFLAVLDGRVSNAEGVFLIGTYLFGLYLLKNETQPKKVAAKKAKHKPYSYIDFVKILGGAALMLFSSNVIVDKTIYFSQVFNVAPFYISLIVLSLGTNLPEITLAVRSVLSGKKDIAFGDYLGSASANTFLFGLFTLLSKGSVLEVNSFVPTFILVALGFLCFFHYSKTNRMITRKEAVLLLFVYVLFVSIEVLLEKGV